MTDSPRSRFHLPHWGYLFMAAIVLLVAAIGLSIWMPIYREQQAVEKVASWGGRLVGIESGGPEWLRQFVGHQRMHKFDRVHSVDLQGSPITDTALAQLGGLTKLQTLYLNGTAVTDAGLAHMSGWRNLRALYLYDTAVTDKGIEKLKKAIPRCDIRH